MRITLRVVAGVHEGLEFSFARHDTFLVGRSKHAHFQLPVKDKYFSRIHFMIEANPPACRLVDMGSHNGTYVNGAKVLSADLKDGDEIRAGHTMLKLALVPEASEIGGLSETVGYESAAPAPAAPLAQPLLPQGFPGYSLVRELGRGGMGVVYLARRSSDGVHLALKTIAPAVSGTKSQIERFLREAHILSELDHPHIVRFRDQGEVGGFLYFVMDYVEGSDADKIVKQEGPLPIRRAVRWACQLLAALDYAHARKYVHRDIKPGNLLVTKQGEKETVKLADFGLARVYQASQLSGLTMTGDVGGTAAYMPPEQITNYRDALPPADQYAAAATLYMLLTGKHIFDLPREIHKQFSIILQEQPVPIQSRRPDVPDALAAAIHQALIREPKQRFDGVSAFRKALIEAMKE